MNPADVAKERADALEEHEKDATVVMIKNGTHDLDRKSDRLTLLREIETFLKDKYEARERSSRPPVEL